MTLFFSTKDGTIVVEFDDPSISVTIKGEDILISDPTATVDPKAKNYKQSGDPIRIRPGEHVLHITRGGLEFDTDKFTLHRGKRVVLTVKLFEGKVQVVRDDSNEVIASKVVPNNAPAFNGENEPEPLAIKPGDPLSGAALVAHPAKIDGLRSWSVETQEHRGWIYDVSYSPYGRLLASAGEDAVIRIWDAKSGRLAQMLLGHLDTVRSLSWSPQSKYLVSSGDEGTIRWWNPASGALLRTVKAHKDIVHSVAWSPNGKFLATGNDDETVQIWNAATGNVIKTLKETEGLSRVDYYKAPVAWSPDGKMLAARLDGKTIGLWDAASFDFVAKLDHKRFIKNIAWSSDGQYLASQPPFQDKIKVWHVKSRRVVDDTLERFYGMAWLPNVNTLTSGSPTSITYTSIEGEIEHKAIFLGPDLVGTLSGIAFSPDGEQLVAAGRLGGLQVMNSASGEMLHRLSRVHPGVSTVYAGWPLATAWDAKGSRLLSGGSDKTVRVWDLNANEFRERIVNSVSFAHKPDITGLGFSADGTTVASGGNTSAILLSDNSSKAQRTIKLDSGQAWGAVAWSPVDERIACSNNGTFSIWNGKTGELIHKLKGTPRILCWTRDGNRLLAGGYVDATVSISETSTGQLLKDIKVSPHDRSVTSIAWSPDEKVIAVGHNDNYENHISLWDVESRERLGLFSGHQGAVVALRWQADNQTLLSLGEDRVLRSWNTKTGEETRALPAPGSNGAFSPDGAFIASKVTGSDRIWSSETGRTNGSLVYLGEQDWLIVDGEGNYRTSPQAPKLVYVALTDTEQILLPPKEFAAKYGWKNDPAKVRLMQVADKADGSVD